MLTEVGADGVARVATGALHGGRCVKEMNLKLEQQRISSETDFQFRLEGKTVRPGTLLHVHPAVWARCGSSGRVERYYKHSGTVMLRHPETLAVPEVRIHFLSWQPYPETVALEQLRAAGFVRPTMRDAAVWLAARR